MLSLDMVKDSKDYSLESLITKMKDISNEPKFGRNRLILYKIGSVNR